MSAVTYQDILSSEEVQTYVRMSDESLDVLGDTEHSFAHVARCAEESARILTELKYPERTVELARIAGYLHDIGNVINRQDHAQSSAVMAFRILDKMGMPPEEIARVITAIGNHDEREGQPIDPISAALILADKSDVRRTRVRNSYTIVSDIYDRVNYAAKSSELSIDPEMHTATLSLGIDTGLCPVMDYFEIFLVRMLMCRKASEFFGLQFKLNINGQGLL